MARRTHSDKEYWFKVNLKGAKRIWRLIAMRGDQTLDDLHEVIFSAFDRFDPHLYSFYFPRGPRRRPSVGLEEPDPFESRQRFNAARTRMDTLGLRRRRGVSGSSK